MELTYELICRARSGDSYAMQQILKHYAGYISHAASVSCAHGRRVVNAPVRESIEADLMTAILRWKEKPECKNR